VHINPLLEAASRRTIVPHEFADMATFRSTRIGTRNVQVRIGGDMALMRGVAKVLFERAAVNPAVIDGEFLERHTQGWQEYRGALGEQAAGAATMNRLAESDAELARGEYVSAEELAEAMRRRQAH
jgi:anaerobic selenocysteine-containing dehydrogenase